MAESYSRRYEGTLDAVAAGVAPPAGVPVTAVGRLPASAAELSTELADTAPVRRGRQRASLHLLYLLLLAPLVPILVPLKKDGPARGTGTKADTCAGKIWDGRGERVRAGGAEGGRLAELLC